MPYQSRYGILREGLDAESSDSDDEAKAVKEKASFLKEQDRKVGPDGFLDSARYIKPYKMKQQKHKEKEKEKEKDKSSDKRSKSTTAVDMLAKIEKDKKEHEKRIKLIEDHMWQHKQEERELKRVEGDIVKKQRLIRHSMRDEENAIVRKRLSEEKKLNQGLEKYTAIQQEHVHKKEQTTKQRVEQKQAGQQHEKNDGHKVQLSVNDLARQYRTKMGQLDLKGVEMNRISQDFETKLRKKEDEQYTLKQELAELAIAINMEAQKGRTVQADNKRQVHKDSNQRVSDDRDDDKTLDKKLAKGDGETKNAEANRRRLSADLMLSRSHMQLKHREEGRHLQDIQNRLSDNVMVQKQLNDASMHAELDLKAKQSEENVAVHDSRKNQRATQAHQQKREKHQSQESVYSDRFSRRFMEQKRREHEDHIHHIQKRVSMGEDMENGLYTHVRSTEYARQKQEQAVRRTQSRLAEMRRNNALKIKSDLMETSREEMTLEQQLTREQAELAKVHAQREESYVRLQQHRSLMREEKYQLVEHEREHSRLQRVGARSDHYLTESY